MSQAAARFRERLRSGQLCLGAGISFTDPLVSEALAGSADFLFVDLEHSGLGHESLLRHLLAARGRGVAGIVRAPGSDEAFIKPILDGGADGIVAPQVRSVDQVRRFVDHCRYPPRGRRGFGPRVPSDYGRIGGDAFCADANENLFVTVQIETAEALDALDDILAVQGLDSVFIGPYDLSAALGVMGQLTHPKLAEAIDRVVAAARAAGKYVGAGMRPDPALAVDMAKRGVQWMQVASDFGLMVRGMDQLTGEVRRRQGP